MTWHHITSHYITLHRRYTYIHYIHTWIALHTWQYITSHYITSHCIKMHHITWHDITSRAFIHPYPHYMPTYMHYITCIHALDAYIKYMHYIHTSYACMTCIHRGMHSIRACMHAINIFIDANVHAYMHCVTWRHT